MTFTHSLRAVTLRLRRRKFFSQTQQRCDRIISDLHPTTPFQMEDFLQQVGNSIDRPIITISAAMPPDGPTGLLVQTPEKTYIIFRRNTSRVHQENIVLHEIAHILCGHVGIQKIDRQRSQSLFPDLDPETVISMLGRAAYSDEQEREAELLGSLLRTKLGTWNPATTWALPEDIASVISRIEKALS